MIRMSTLWHGKVCAVRDRLVHVWHTAHVLVPILLRYGTVRLPPLLARSTGPCTHDAQTRCAPSLCVSRGATPPTPHPLRTRSILVPSRSMSRSRGSACSAHRVTQLMREDECTHLHKGSLMHDLESKQVLLRKVGPQQAVHISSPYTLRGADSGLSRQRMAS